MACRAELFVREVSDGESDHCRRRLLKPPRRSRNSTVQHRAMLLFASFQVQSVTQIAELHRASATHVAELIDAFNAEGFAARDPRRAEAVHAGSIPGSTRRS
jgi:3-mercaptopyruvate sulfurtransferase SseA